MGVGLWLPAPAARALREGDAAARFGDWLRERGLDVFTINGFPYDDFHLPKVKHRVYQPTWADPDRLQYTRDLMHLLAEWRPGGGEGSISTLPLGWRADFQSPDAVAAASAALLAAVETAAEIEDATGRLIHLDLEPEPGCALERSTDVTAFFERDLLPAANPERLRRHLRVCHDVCHAAVMFEPQAEVVARYDEIGVLIGKVQISSAVRVRFDGLDADDRRAAAGQLAAFGEERYLHQTMVRHAPGAGAVGGVGGAGDVFYEDLPQALAAAGEGEGVPTGEWRIHYHVPIHLEGFGRLETTRDEIERCVEILRDRPEVRHYEVETYAWEVLPADLRAADLAEGIAREITWFAKHAKTGGAA